MLVISAGFIYCFSLFMIASGRKNLLQSCIASLLFAFVLLFTQESILVFLVSGILAWLMLTLLSDRSVSECLHFSIAFTVITAASDCVIFYILNGLIPAFLFIHYTDAHIQGIYHIFSACFFQTVWLLYTEAVHLRVYQTDEQDYTLTFCDAAAVCVLTYFAFIFFRSDRLLAYICLVCVLIIIINILLDQFLQRKSHYIAAKHKADSFQKELVLRRELQKKMTQNLQDTYSLRHNMKNTMIMILGNMNAGRLSEAEKIVRTYVHDLDRITSVIYTHDPALNLLLSNKISAIHNKCIETKIQIQLGHHTGIKSEDLAIILGNVLDNVLCHCSGNPKKMDMRILHHKDTLMISVSNTVSADAENSSYDPQDVHPHGYGLEIIEKIVETYGGYVITDTADSVYLCDILLPDPQKN